MSYQRDPFYVYGTQTSKGGGIEIIWPSGLRCGDNSILLDKYHVMMLRRALNKAWKNVRHYPEYEVQK